MSKKQTVVISAFLIIVFAITLITGGLKMQKAYGSTYIISEDEIFKDVKIYSTSDTHSLFVAESEGQQKLFVKGENNYGQLGTKDYQAHIPLTQVLVGLPESKIIKVWALTNASFILAENGKLYAAGNNNSGKLGVDSSEDTINEFSEVVLPPEAVGHIVGVQGNGNFTIFKTDIGKFYGSGDNTYGQLGLPESIAKAKDVNGSPVIEIANDLLDSSSNPVIVKDMAAGKDFTVLIDDSQKGNIYFAGNNSGNSSNGAKQSATDFLPNTVFGFTFVTNVSKYDTCYYHTSELSPNNYYIIASDEIYAVINGMIVTEEFKSITFLLENYTLGSEVFPEVFIFSPLFEDIDFTTFSTPYSELDVFDSASFADILGDSDGVHGIKYADWITPDTGDFQVPQSKSDFWLLNEGLLFWFKSKHTNILYLSYFGNNNELSPSFIPWLKNTGFLYTEEHIISLNEANSEMENVSASQKTLIYSAADDSNNALFMAGDNTNGIISPYIDSDIDISMYNIMSLKLSEIEYPFYITDISPSTTSFSMNVGEQKTVSFNPINRPKLTINAKSNTEEKPASVIITYNEIIDDRGIIKGIDVIANEAGNVTIEVFNDGKNPIKLFDITFDINAPENHNMSFEDGLNNIAIGETLDVVFWAPADYIYETDFELRTNKTNILMFSHPIHLETSEDNMSRYYTTITPISPIADSADLEIWVLGSDPQCIVSKTINIIEPIVEEIDIGFSENMPTTINVGEIVDVMQYVTPQSEATNISYTVLNDGEVFLRKIESSIGSFEGMSAGVATIRINHPYAINYKDFTLTVIADESNPSDQLFAISSIITSLNLIVDETATIAFTTHPSGNENKVIISSDNNNICTINTTNKTITAVGVGSTFIRLSSSDAVAPLLIPVTVTSNVTISAPKSITVEKGEKVRIPVSISPESENDKLVYSVNNTNAGVSQNGYVTGIRVGTAIITILHPSTNTSKTVVVTIINSDNDNENNEPDSRIPRIVLGNTLNDKGELEVVLGGKIELNVSVKNYTGNVTYKYEIADYSKISIADKMLKGENLGRTTLTVSTNLKISPLQIAVNVIRAPYSDNEIKINFNEIKTYEQKQEDKQKKKIVLKQNQRYKINVSGLVKDIDIENYFDKYFIVRTMEQYVSYLGNGVLRANYPGETTIYLYKINGKELIEEIQVFTPYPEDFFNEMPEATGIPFNRTIRITFNQDILAASVNEKSVFVQDKADGNGTNLDRTVSISKNVLYVSIPLPEDDNSKTKTVYIYIIPAVLSTSYTPVYAPIVIPVTFVK